MAKPAVRADERRRFGTAEVVGATVTLLWIGVVALVAVGDGGSLQLWTVVASVVPLVLIWIAISMLRAARALRAEAAGLRRTMALMREAGPEGARPAAPAAQPITGDPAQSSAEIAQRLEALMAAQARVEAALEQVLAAGRSVQRTNSGPGRPRRPSSQAHGAPPGLAEAATAWVGPDDPARPALTDATPSEPGPPGVQPVLALGVPDGADPDMQAPVTVPDFLRALNFPDTVEDAQGFDALRAGLADPRAARVIRAAQDVLTLLSEDGIYMDDLMPPPRIPSPDLWRRFARGERGSAVAALGGIEDPVSLERTATRMREDAVFRDVAHHFLRHFDRMIEALEPNVTDADFDRLARTRSARAFMLLGRVSGSFG